MTTLNTTTLIEQEITRLHEFFQKWFQGTLPNTEQSMQILSQALVPTFTLVTPQGKTIEKQDLINNIKRAWGTRKNQNFKITIHNIQLLYQDHCVILASYEEWQHTTNNTTKRISTVLFKHNLTRNNKLQWIRVHETWLHPLTLPQ